MFKKSLFFHLTIFCTSLIANPSQLDVSCIKPPITHSGMSEHFKTVCERIQDRWHAFETSRIFKPFEIGTSDAILKDDFENIRNTRYFIWTTSGYERAQHLIENDLVRAPGCVAFAYNNTAPYYNASTLYLNNRYYIACEGPRSKDISKFFTLLISSQVTHLVRLTDSHEGNIEKCHPYWEGRLSKSDDGNQRLNIPTENGMYSIRAFDMAYWRDNQGVDPQKLLALVLQVRQEVTDSNNGLLLVHCSAGVGRTGTFLAALAIVEAIDQGEPFSIEEIVYKLSLQRVSSVARQCQYITLHRLAECYLRQKS